MLIRTLLLKQLIPSAIYSSFFQWRQEALNSFDGDQSTGWTAAANGTGGGDSAGLTVNLGAKYDICKVIVNWGSDYAKAFMLARFKR